MGVVVVYLRHIPDVHLTGLKETAKIFNHDIRSPHRSLNSRLLEYKAQMLTVHLRCSHCLLEKILQASFRFFKDECH
jgi:cytochrome c-type biogenesis protein CcmH/NrfF